MADVPSDAPEHCPGTQSEAAGKVSACEGCPNQSVCASSKPIGPDPAIAEVQERLGTIQHKILILSGKGGVGKSTVTANLAHGIAKDPDKQVAMYITDDSYSEECDTKEVCPQIFKIAVLDIDICGPSMPKILGVEGEKVHHSGSGWSPVYAEENIAVMSIGFLLEHPDDAVIWRGPKKNGLIKQFLKDVDWGDADFLLIDTPPGTSDEHLSVVQYLSTTNVHGAVIVTTPQEVSLQDVRKEINFCRKVNLPIIGVIENMSGFVCPTCKTESQIFPPTTGGAERMTQEMKVPLLGKLPLDPRIGRCCDEGKNLLDEVPDSAAAVAYKKIINRILESCGCIESTQSTCDDSER